MLDMFKNDWRSITDDEKLRCPSALGIEQNTEQVRTLILNNMRVTIDEVAKPLQINRSCAC
jgi:hypothetical protein